MITILAEIKTRAGQRERVLQALYRVRPDVLAEEGCVAYQPMVDKMPALSSQKTAPDSIVIVEQWHSVQHQQKHLETPHMKAYKESISGDVLEVVLQILENAPAA